MGSQIGAFILDLDGVVWTGNQGIAGASEAVQKLRSEGISVGFVTNMSYLPLRGQVKKLAQFGIEAEGQVITSAVSAASLLKEGEKVMISGGAGIDEAVLQAGAEVVNEGPADAVIVGMNPEFSYEECNRVMRAVREGARLIGTNHDPTYPTPFGLAPGGGAMLAAIATASEVEPIVSGKPNQPMADCIQKHFGEVEMVVGDRPDSDGLLAEVLGADFGLVLSGVTQESDLPVEPKPKIVSQDLANLVKQVLS